MLRDWGRKRLAQMNAPRTLDFLAAGVGVEEPARHRGLQDWVRDLVGELEQHIQLLPEVFAVLHRCPSSHNGI